MWAMINQAKRDGNKRLLRGSQVRQENCDGLR